MGRKVLIIILLVLAVAVGIAYTMAQSSQTAQPSTNTANCKPENLAGNFTSSPEMNSTSSGPYSLTFYIQNLASQSTTITQYADMNGLTQSVNWTIAPYASVNFNATINTPENSLVLKTSCGTLLTVQVYYPNPPSSDQAKHYEVKLYVSLGGAAQ